MDVSPEGDTGRARQLTDDDRRGAADPSWSPDGKEIVFADDQDIYTIDVNSLEETRLTDTPDYDHDPTWSPTGKRIVFPRDYVDTSSAIYVMRSDGSDLKLIRDFPSANGKSGYHPYTIRPDWRELP